MGGIVGGLGSIVGGVVGNLASADDRDRAQSAINEALAEIRGIGAPPDMAREIFLKKFEEQGILTPEMEQNINAQFEKINASSEGRNAQLAALKKLTGLSETGLDAQDRLAFMKAAQDADRENAARQASIMQNMAQRGQSGSGAELAARLQGAQSASNQLSSDANEVAAAAAARALQALTGMGNLGGQIQSQDTDLAARQAAIANEQERFNVGNQLAQQSRNVAAKNMAQERNLQRKETVADANVNVANQDALRRLRGEMDTYNAKAQQAQRVAGMLTGQVAPMYRDQAQQTAQFWQDLGSGVGNMGSQLLTKKKKSGQALGEELDGVEGFGPTVAGSFSGLGALAMYKGGEVPNLDGGNMIPGDHPENDCVMVELSPGEVVLPRSIAKDPEMAKKFVKHLMKK